MLDPEVGSSKLLGKAHPRDIAELCFLWAV